MPQRNSGDVNWLEVWKGRVLRRKWIAAVVAAVAVVFWVAGGVNGILSLLPGSPAPRLMVGAFELGADLPMAMFGGDAGFNFEPISRQEYESRVRTNLNLLGLDGRFPPDPIPPARQAYIGDRKQVVLEQIQPAIASRGDEVADAFEYAYDWSWIGLGLVMMANGVNPEGPFPLSPGVQRGFVRQTLIYANDPYLQELESRLGLSVELKIYADLVRHELVSRVTYPVELKDVASVYTLLIEYLNAVREELCSRPRADCQKPWPPAVGFR
jgi:hypothetical protein